uniref:Uncharacterized protein n=1 Tax=Knipowitschia caucasica TaxID=637954 RepID=A0AAV2J6A2_KNICA
MIWGGVLGKRIWGVELEGWLFEVGWIGGWDLCVVKMWFCGFILGGVGVGWEMVRVMCFGMVGLGEYGLIWGVGGGGVGGGLGGVSDVVVLGGVGCVVGEWLGVNVGGLVVK